MKNKPNIRYIVELVITLLLVLFIAVVLVSMFVLSKGRSDYAQNMTEAVKLAESIAELNYGTDDEAEFVALLQNMDNVVSVVQTDHEIMLQMYGNNNKQDQDTYLIIINRSRQEADYGKLIYDDIEVFAQDAAEPIYSLQTGNYISGKEAE